MNVESLVAEFLKSNAGRDAHSALVSKGICEHDAQNMLRHATQAGCNHVAQHQHGRGEHHHGLLGDHPVRNFFAGFAAGLFRGDGIMGALGDGMEGVVAGRITEAIEDAMGVDHGMAETAAAAAAPFIVGFLKNKLA